MHQWVRVFCRLRSVESCQGVICGKSSAKHSANYPLSLFCIPQLKNGYRYWTTGRCANSRIANSRTGRLADWTSRGRDKLWSGQLADSTGDFACFCFLAIRETASCPVRDLSSLRVDLSTRCPVRELAIHELLCLRVVQ